MQIASKHFIHTYLFSFKIRLSFVLFFYSVGAFPLEYFSLPKNRNHSLINVPPVVTFAIDSPSVPLLNVTLDPDVVAIKKRENMIKNFHALSTR